MTKATLSDIVSERLGVSKIEAVDYVEHVIEIIKETLESGESVKVSGFGNFQVKSKSPRRGRNPQTGDDLTIDARKVVSFKASTLLRNHINDEE
ncbi:integration host factor subunit alpha [Oryzomonas rubra]|uniref:Integration host factor subunit alpha n=1 Tax=Oryzomonas rubra TaxID=2509454 RepID=A0A5A9X5A6_9BACT|nr:integration host factor subunit alpha [Oryzomonas rubra]KAA0888180.1 integration host factor subunit alpha [Oryzomonas rubra]